MSDFTGASGTTYRSPAPSGGGSFDVTAEIQAVQNNTGGAGIIGADGVYVPPGPGGGEAPFVFGDASRILYNEKTPDQIAEIQDVLAEAGILRSAFTRGRIGPETLSAYEEVLRQSNSQGAAPSAIISRMAISNFGARVARAGDRIANPDPGPSRAPFTARASNPADLKRYFRDAVVSATGENRGTVDLDRMVDAYLAVERNAQADAYNTQATGGTVTDPVSLEGFTEDTLAEVVPEEVQTRNVVDRAGQLFGMLGSFGGQ